MHRRVLPRERATGIQFVYTSNVNDQQRAVLSNLSANPDLRYQTAFSLSTRVRIDAETPGYQYLFGLWGNFVQYSILYRNGAISFESFRYNSTGFDILFTLPFTIALGVFYIIKFVYDGTSIYWYVNGNLVQTQPQSVTLTEINDQDPRFLIGGGPNGNYAAATTLDWLEVEAAGTTLVNLQFNRPNPHFNSGSAGGNLILTGTPLPQFIQL